MIERGNIMKALPIALAFIVAALMALGLVYMAADVGMRLTAALGH